jgi:Protein of unknown function (DUF3800)
MNQPQALTFIYCDESCHIEHDHQPNMVLGAIACPKQAVSSIHAAIRAIKARHNLTGREIKFNKVSPAKVAFYQDLIGYFFETSALRFRGLIASKEGLNHGHFQQSHDQWYYKMYYYLLNGLLNKQERFHIFLDIKDTQGSKHRSSLRTALCNTHYDFDTSLIRDIQAVHSQEVELVQLTDLLVGCLMYANRPVGEQVSEAKNSLVAMVKAKSRYALVSSTPLGECKFNVFRWQPRNEER